MKIFPVISLSISIIIFSISCQKNDIDSIKNEETVSVSQSQESFITGSFDSEPTHEIRFIKEQMYQSSEEVYFSRMHRVAVDDLERVYVGGGKTIHIFQPDGQYLTQIGRDGSGPGEFRARLYLMPKIHSNRLFVYDEVLHRINIYSLNTLAHIHTILISPDQWQHIPELENLQVIPRANFSNFFPVSDSTLFMEFRMRPPRESVMQVAGRGLTRYDEKQRYFLMDMDGKIVSDQILSLTDAWTVIPSSITFNSPTSPYIYERNSLVTVSNDGHIYTAWTEEFKIDIYEPNGEYLRSFYNSFDNASFDKQAYIDFLAWLGVSSNSSTFQWIRDSELPATWPALQTMIADDEGRIWVATIIDDPDHYEWWVLDRSGDLLARFMWPAPINYRLSIDADTIGPKVIKGGYLYVAEEADDTLYGDYQIVKYRIELEERVE